MHNQRLDSGGEVGGPTPMRRENGAWHPTPQGYMVGTRDGRLVAHHRHVMEDHLGRTLTKDENVHHINGDRADNRIENLELWNKSQPAGQRVTDKIAWAIELLGKYHPELLADQAVQLRLVAS